MKEKFHLEQWEHYRSKGLAIANVRMYSGGISFPAAIDSSIVLKNKPDGIFKFYSFQEFFKEIKGINSCFLDVLGHKNNQTAFDFFCIFYKKASLLEQKELVKNFSDYSGKDFSKIYPVFCDTVLTSALDKLNFIKKVPITLLDAHSIKMPEFYDFLTQQGLDKNQAHQYMVEFFKPRKTQLKHPSTASDIKKYLKKNFNFEQVKEYFSFFPSLQSDYEEVDIDIFSNNHTLSTLSTIKVKNVIQKYGISNWNEDVYFQHFYNLTHAIGQRFKTDSACVREVDKHRVITLEFLHDNPELTQNVLNELVMASLSDLKNNPLKPQITDRDTCKIWLNKYYLEKGLEHKEEIVKKMKI